MRFHEKCKWLVPALAAILLAGCGSSAPIELTPVPDKTSPSAEESPTLVVKDEESGSAPDFSGAQPNTSNEDLMIMSSEEETGFALFCPKLSEKQFRDMLQKDGADFIPDRLAQQGDQYYAYYNSKQQSLVVCDSALEWFRNVRITDGGADSRILDVQWLNENCVMVLSGSEAQQYIYTYQPQEESLQCVYSSPEDKVILEMTVTPEGQVDCTLTDRAYYNAQLLQEAAVEDQTGEAQSPATDTTEATPPEAPPQETVRVTVPAQ